MSANNRPDWQWNRDGNNAGSNSSASRQLPGEKSRTPATSDAQEEFGSTSPDRAAVRNIYLLFESYQSGGKRVDSLADLQWSRLLSHSASARDDACPPPSGRMWIRAACLLIAAATVLCGWVWLVRLLLAP
ncbi:hypothetical protein [Variovorax rhizosphaerae]|uniref:Uncharacterized protein n=1 Tax=Variovorax rhizosphaerae TaxID=1836200 RepID=A0ABU8WYK1_9BURK